MDLSGCIAVDDVNWSYVTVILGLMVITLMVMLLVVGTIFGICQLVVKIVNRKQNIGDDLDFSTKAKRDKKMKDQGLD